MSRLVCGLADQPLQRFGSVHSVINQLHQPKVPGGLSGTLTLGRVLVETLSLQNAYDFIYTGKFADLTSPARFALREKERLVILLRYYRDMTQQQIANRLGISQVQVSRIEKKALRKMREKMMIE